MVEDNLFPVDALLVFMLISDATLLVYLWFSSFCALIFVLKMIPAVCVCVLHLAGRHNLKEVG